MAINFSNLLLEPSPIVQLGGMFGSGGGSMERERLKLMREQFEETKRQNEQDNRYREMALEGQMARERLGLQKQREADEAARIAKLQEGRLAAQQKFAELNASGDIEGARAMVPTMTALGMGVELEGEEGGLPRYRIDMDAAATEKAESARAAQASPYGPGETAEQSLSRLGAMGFPEETGSLDAPVGIASTDEIGPEGLTVAERVASTYGEPGEKTPMVAPGTPDMTGGVPRNVIDMGAIQGQTLQRLDPAMSGIIAGLPEQYQGSARSTAAGIRGMGLPAAKALDAFGKFQGDANTLIKGELDAEREAAKQAYAANSGSDKEGFDRYKAGYDTIAKEVASKYGVESRLRARGLYEQAMKILSNKTAEDDYLVLSLISRSFGERGATTEGDVARALGLPATSTWDQITGWLSSRLEGGIPEPNKRALIGVLKTAVESNDGEIRTFSDRLLELADDPETDRDVSRGIRDYWRATVPKSMRDARDKERGGTTARRAPGETDGQGELDYVLDLEASAANLNTDAIRRVIQLESGGNPAARNAQSGATGLIQFMPETAKALGTTTEELAQMPVEDQVRYVVKYFENAGITADSPPDDYALAVAAPAFVGKPDDTVVYPQGSKAWEQNAPWRPAGGGDITVGSIKAAYAKKGGAPSNEGEKPLSELSPEARRARIAELRKMLGRQ